jgi:ATP-dependent exoDNAse (exonuclease V) beta subunit
VRSAAGQLSFDLERRAEPADEEQRRRIRTELARDVFVEAGAGTGKTSVLVARIVELVASATCELREVGAITFTEAAALELRERVRDALFERAGRSEHGERFSRALEQIDESTLTTIHGFAQRILSEHAIAAGLPPRFSVMDEVAQVLDFERRSAVALDQIFDDRSIEEALGAGMLIGIRSAQLKDLLRALAQDPYAARIVADESWLLNRACLSERLIFEHVALLRQSIATLQTLSQHCSDEEDLLWLRIADLVAYLDGLADDADWMDQLAWLAQLAEQRVANRGRKDNWRGDALSDARAAFVTFEEQRARALSEIGEAVLAGLAGRLAREVLAWAEDRRATGVVAFDDLLVLTRDLLVQNPAVRNAVRRRHSRLLVDEFQDTDPLQLDILRALATEGAGDGSMFYVGDPRQSIYRFRGADLALYERARADVEPGDLVHLVTNFRSRPGIVEYVNHTFGELMDTSNFVPLVAARPATQGAPPVAVLGGVLEEESASARRELEANDISSFISDAISRRPVLVSDGALERRARYGDVAILVPRRTGLYELESALQANEIPYRVASSSLVYGSQEVRDLLVVLRAVASPAEEPALVAALRSPIFACSDEDLLAFHRAGGQWRLGDQPELEANAPADVISALEALTRYHALSASSRPTQVYDAIVSGEKIAQLFATKFRGNESLRRLSFLNSRVRAFSRAGGDSLLELIDWLEFEAESGVRQGDVNLDDDEDVVRIMTIHGAKGLEFPIVVLADLGGPIRVAPRGPVVVRDGDLVEIRISAGVETTAYRALADTQAERERAEAIRLCYVGATRARDHLLVCLSHRPARTETARSLAELIHVATEQRRHLVRDETKWRVGPSPRRRSPAKALVDGPAANEQSYLEAKRAVERVRVLASVPGSVASSALVAAGGDRDEESDAFGARSRSPYGRAVALSIGRAVHRVLQHVELRDGVDLDERVATAVLEEHCEAYLDDVRRLAQRALAAPIMQEAARADRVYRELPVGLRVNDGVLESVVDLCFFGPRGLVIVDYKTDALSSSDALSQHGARYRIQAGAYALALSRALASAIDRVVLLFAGAHSGALEFEVDALDEAMAEAESLAKTRLFATD